LAFTDVMLEHGTVAGDWDISPEDTDQRMSIAESEIVQLADEIRLKVDVDGIVSEINLKKEGIRIAGDLIHLDGLTLIDSGIIQSAHIADAAIERAHLGRAIIDDAHIDELTGKSIVSKTITVDHLNVAKLASISADLGTVKAGVLKSNNTNTEWNLNTGEFYMNNNDITFGSSANIMFNSRGNQILHAHYDDISGYTRSAGLGVGRAIGNRYPFAYLGAQNNSRLDTLGSGFSGFIAN